MINLEEKVKESVIEILKEMIKIYDNLFLNCDARKKQFNVCDTCHRSIFTIFGLLEFDRIYYYDKSDRTKHFYFIDTLFKLPQYDRYDCLIKGISNLKLYSEKEIMHCLCEFHVKQKINRITKGKNQVRLLIDYINNNNKKEFVSLIQDIMKSKYEKRKRTIEEYKNYLIKYWKAFKNMLNSKVRSSMESHISHNVTKYFSYEPKAYPKRKIQKLIKLQEYKSNGINILGLYLKSYKNHEKVTLKKKN